MEALLESAERTRAGEVWASCLQVIEQHISPAEFGKWFGPIKPLKIYESELTLQIPSEYFYEYIDNHYAGILRAALNSTLGENATLNYAVILDTSVNEVVEVKRNAKLSPVKPIKIEPQNGRKLAESDPRFKDFILDLNLHENYNFDNFVEGDCNRLARAAGVAIAKQPGNRVYNPLMIYGGVGLGKTHLISAIGNKIKQTYPDKLVLYVSTERFMNQYIDSVSSGKLQDFYNFYITVDVLIIDDIQFLTGKEKMQEMFFNIFNHMHQRNNQIVLTSDCPPKDLKGMHDRLISRFKSGLVADLHQPDFETRAAIIQRKMSDDGLEIPHEVVMYLAETVDSNIRELEGVVIRLIAERNLSKRELDIKLAKEIVAKIISTFESKIDFEKIITTVGEHFEVSPDELCEKTRQKRIVTPRQIAMYIVKELTGNTLKNIGQLFGGFDHSTVLHAIDNVSKMINDNQEIRIAVDEIKNKLKQNSAA